MTINHAMVYHRIQRGMAGFPMCDCVNCIAYMAQLGLDTNGNDLPIHLVQDSTDEVDNPAGGECAPL